MSKKQTAYMFLKALERRLENALATRDTVIADIERRDSVKPADQRPEEDRLACRENLFLYHHVLKQIFDQVAAELGSSNARSALRGEYYSKFPVFLSGNSRSSRGYPFAKGISKDVSKIYERWMLPGKINESYPDLSIVRPMPFRMVVEAKYFVGAAAAAKKELVDGIYQTLFYRAQCGPDGNPPLRFLFAHRIRRHTRAAFKTVLGHAHN
jgi:hypothetical protein